MPVSRITARLFFSGLLLGLASPGTAATTIEQRTVYLSLAMNDLSIDAQAVLDDMLEAWKRNPTARLVITAHTDRSGSDAVNLRFSKRRAAEVARYFTARGVPARLITAIGKGESEPALPTADGVREPLNRRVVIELVIP